MNPVFLLKDWHFNNENLTRSSRIRATGVILDQYSCTEMKVFMKLSSVRASEVPLADSDMQTSFNIIYMGRAFVLKVQLVNKLCCKQEV